MSKPDFLIQMPVMSFERPWDIQLLEWVREMRSANQQQLARVEFWDKADKAMLKGYIHAFDMMEKRILRVRQFATPASERSDQ